MPRAWLLFGFPEDYGESFLSLFGLGRIEITVGRGQDGVEIFVLRGHKHPAEGNTDRNDLSVGGCVGNFRECLTKTREDKLNFFKIAVFEENSDFIGPTTHARRKIRGPDRTRDSLTNCCQDPITLWVAPSIINRFEIVNVEEEKNRGYTLTICQPDV